jgi:hypothetical protein
VIFCRFFKGFCDKHNTLTNMQKRSFYALMCCLYSEKCTMTSYSENGHVDLVLLLHKDLYLTILTISLNFATAIT